MPAIRTPACSNWTSTGHDVGRLSPYESILDPGFPPACTSRNAFGEPAAPVNKKRRAPNAFFLFRSYFIANRLYPPEIIHQAEVSRYVSVVWRNMTAIERSVFFKMAEEEKLRFEVEGPREVKKKVRPCRPRTKKPRSSKRDMQYTKLDQPLGFPQSPASPSSTSTLSSDQESTSSDLFSPSFNITTPLGDNALLASSAQYDWISSPSNFTSPQHGPPPEWTQGLLHPTTSSVYDTTPETAGLPLDYALLFDIDFLLSSEMALMSTSVGNYNPPTSHMQLPSSDLWNLPCDPYGFPLLRF